ncbi:MAG: DUF192 domain-containing protein [bacterium]|nr:hypothetical protein [Deltaproteobacteria bacterium]MCP4907317.1 DUF192 domain-containing protein [bacterium]
MKRGRIPCFTLMTALLVLACSNADSEPPPDAWVEIESKRIAVELAETPADQAKGLGYREDLPWNTGMYFTYDRPAFYSFWMKGMRFPIDIVWIRAGRIVDLHRDVPFEPGGNGPTLQPREIIDAVLEVPAGYAAANGWRIGNRVRLDRPNEASNPTH